MEDRHRFKVWCENNKEWEKDEILISSKGHYIVNGRIFGREPKNHKVVFCTGLKDKHGKLAFFGDIAKDENGIIDEITWFEGMILFNGQAVTGKTDGDRLGYYMFELEIIGNVYQNKELLEGRE